VASWVVTGLGIVAMLASMLTFIVSGSRHASAGPPAAMFGYVPLPADELQEAFESINTAANTTLDFTVGITNASDGAVAYYDHWEDGYEADVANPVQATTLIWGDGDPLNGDASTVCSTCAGDLLTAGDVFVLRNDITTPRNTAEIRWDGRDKVASTRGFALTAGGWTTPLGSVLAAAVSAYDTSRFGTSFVVPIGEDTPFPVGSTPPFEYTSASIMAAQADTVVDVDADNNGSFELSQTIGEGETFFVDGGLDEGARIRSDKRVQVHLVTGDVNATYEQHSYTLFPTALLTNTYVNPVASATTNQETIVYLYNPNGTQITITPTCTSCSGTIAVPTETSVSFTMPAGEAVQLASGGETFVAVGAMGAQSGAGGGTDSSSVYDWGFSLVPADILTSQVVLGWAPGASDLPPSADDYDPVWATTFAATTLHVDFDGDPTTGSLAADCVGQHDLEIAVGALASTRITDPGDNSMTGARVYTCDGTAVAAAWGEDPSTAPTGSPGLDAGYTVVPTTTMLVNKSSALAIDSNGDGRIGPGDTIEYTVMISNAGGVAFTNVLVDDALSSDLDYVTGSTVLDDGVTITPIADDITPPALTAFPMDEAGLSIPNIPAGDTVFLRFRGALENPYGSSDSTLANAVDVTADEGSSTSTDQADLATADLSLTKTETASPQFVGQNAVFEVTVANAGPDLAPAVQVQDLLPAGLAYQSHLASDGTYVPGTGVWSVGDVASGDSATLEITARVDTASAITNFAEVTLVGAVDPDSQPAEDALGPGNPPNQDDEGSVTLDVDPRADLSLTKARIAGPDVTGSTTYQLTVTNDGPSDATGITVTEQPPPGAAFDSATPSQGTFDDLTGVWTVGSVSNGANATLDITYVIDPNAAPPGGFPATNRAEITTADQADPDSQPAENPLDESNPPDQDDEDEVTITLSADLSLSKTETALPQFVGDNAVFEITVTNDGPDPAHSVEVDDLLPAGLAHVSNTPSTGTYTPGTGVWAIGSIDSGDSVTLSITARVTTEGTLDNTAQVAASGAPDPDSTPGNSEPAEDDQDTASISTTGGSLGDTVWFDVNGNGTQDSGEPGLAGVDVTVIDAGPNGTLGDGDDVTLPTVTTDSSGAWTVTGLGPGPYRVNVDATTLPIGLDAPTADPDGITSANTADVSLSAGEQKQDADFGYTGTATVGDTIFLDFNGNGMPDNGVGGAGSGNEGIAGVDVEITWAGFDDTFGTSDDQAYNATSDASGVWSISGIPAGTVRVQLDLSTLPPGIDNYVDPDGGNDGISEITIGAGSTDMNQDFGFLGLGSLGHLIFRDDNDNGTFEASEGLAGVEVEVQWAGANNTFGDGDDYTYAAITDSVGDYGVGNLAAGDFQVTVIESTLPAGATNTVDPDGGNNNRSALVLGISGVDLDQNFGYIVPSGATAGTGALPLTGSTMLGQLVLGGLGLSFTGVGLVLGAAPGRLRRILGFFLRG
jgi:uncharacterized repeat protein (TIGR01451 family)